MDPPDGERRVPKHFVLLSLLVTSSLFQLSRALDESSGAPPRISVHPKNVTVLDRKAAILICEADGEPKPTLTWLKDGQKFNKLRIPIIKYNNGILLKIEPFRNDRDSGIFECLVENGIGEPIRSQVHVRAVPKNETPTGFPHIISQPVDTQKVEIGGNATIVCLADGDPQPEYLWLHESVPVRIPDPRQRIVVESGALKISNVTESDKGTYLCVADNSKGLVTSSTSELQVSLEPLPDEPPTALRFRLTSPKNVTLTWAPPENKNNVTIIGYQIFMSRLNTSEYKKIELPNVNSWTKDDLEENTEYSFRVSAKTRAGIGRPSRTISFTTPKDPPPTPTNVDVEELTTHSVSTRVRNILIFTLSIVIVSAVIVIAFYRKQRQALKATQTNETTIRLLPDPIYSAVPVDCIDRRNTNYHLRATMNHPAISVNELAEHIEVLKTNNNLKDEYESIEPGQQFTWEHSYMDFNRHKNRYGNVVAYDHSRVILSQIDGIPGSDYINANYCDGYAKPKHYIATQGPLPNTVHDFWRMVWEQNSRTIVMMTQLEERGRVKCVQFWPSRDSVTYHGLTITASGVEELAYYNIRTFRLQFNGETKEVKQFQFTAWPDHGVPDHPTPFLIFLRRIKVSNPLDAGPMVVLCSAGVGRTGCFIVIDSMIERIKQENTVDIYGHVTSLRAQRNYIVQAEDQYMFIHEAVLEAVIQDWSVNCLEHSFGKTPK